MAEANENTPLLGAAGGAARQVPETLFLAALFLFFVLFSASSGFFQFSLSFCFPCRDSKKGTFICPTLKGNVPFTKQGKLLSINYFLIEAAFLIERPFLGLFKRAFAKNR